MWYLYFRDWEKELTINRDVVDRCIFWQKNECWKHRQIIGLKNKIHLFNHIDGRKTGFFSYFIWIRLDKVGTSRYIKVKLVIAFLYISNNVSKIKLLVLILNIGIFFFLLISFWLENRFFIFKQTKILTVQNKMKEALLGWVQY